VQSPAGLGKERCESVSGGKVERPHLVEVHFVGNIAVRRDKQVIVLSTKGGGRSGAGVSHRHAPGMSPAAN
jgi:hypothetical protein